MISPTQLYQTIRFFEELHMGIDEFIISLLNYNLEARNNAYTNTISQFRVQLCHPNSLNGIISALVKSSHASNNILRIAHNITDRRLAGELGNILEKSHGFQINASQLTVKKILQFSRFQMASDLEKQCPYLWRLFQLLLNASVTQTAALRLEGSGDYLTTLVSTRVPNAGANETHASSEPFNLLVDQDGLQTWNIHPSMLKGRRKSSGDAKERQSELAEVRAVSVFGILMQSSNVRCNALQTMLALFTHSSNTPERVVEVMAHVGLSISPSSILNMVSTLSKDAERILKQQLPNLTAAIAYDNLDINFGTEEPTVDYSGKLIHITTGTFFPLQCASSDDLRVSKEIWEKSSLNPNRDPLEPVIEPTHPNLISLMRSASDYAPEDPLSIESQMAWHVREMLLRDDTSTIAPALKDKFRLKLGLPAAKLSIPVVKTMQYPAKAMHISVSTNSGNAVALENLLEQGGAIDSMLDDHVVIVHGDLGSGEHIENLKASRSIEETPRDRLQHIQYVPGLLHTEMAITDAIWRAYLENQDPGSGVPLDPRSVFHLCSLGRPRDSRKLATSPDHQMKDRTVRYAVAALIGEAWRTEVESRYAVKIEEWQPTWEQIEIVSRRVVRTYIADMSFVPRSSGEGDMVNDNTKLFCRDVLLWIMVRHASRRGDVGALEDLLPFWVCIWKHTGKHKYAEYIAKFLLNLKQIWPQKFANVVRMNWLVNPKGVADGFRAADWVVERNNLMHKVMHAGDGANRSANNIIKESTLILVYQRALEIVEQNFHITPSTLNHTSPVMDNTLALLQLSIRDGKMHSHIQGRTLSSAPINSIAAGLSLGLDKLNESKNKQFEADEDEESVRSGGTSAATASDAEGNT